MLARDLVGWDVIATYDELVLANDSGYLVQPFDQVFARMDAGRRTGGASRRRTRSSPLASTKRPGRRLARRGPDARGARRRGAYSDFIHVGSYFLALPLGGYRGPGVPAPPRHGRRAVRQDCDHPQVRDRHLALPHPRRLPPGHLRRRHPALPPRLPRVGLHADARRLPAPQAAVPLREPFPSPTSCAGRSACWRRLPEPTSTRWSATSARLARRSTCTELRGPHPPTAQVVMPGPVEPDKFADEEAWTPRYDHWWAFPVDPVSHRLEGNARAVFEAVAPRPVDQQVVLTASWSPGSPAPTWSPNPIESMPGQYYLLRPGTIFVTGGPRSDVNHPLSGRRHRFVGLRRGTPVPRSARPSRSPTPRKDETAICGPGTTTTSRAPSSPRPRPNGRPWKRRAPPGGPSPGGSPARRAPTSCWPGRRAAADLRRQAAPCARASPADGWSLWHRPPRGPARRTLPGSSAEERWLRSWLADRDAVLGVRPPVTGR